MPAKRTNVTLEGRGGGGGGGGGVFPNVSSSAMLLGCVVLARSRSLRKRIDNVHIIDVNWF